MLHVIDNYYAQTNNYGYSVLRDTGKQNPKTGEQTDRILKAMVGINI